MRPRQVLNKNKYILSFFPKAKDAHENTINPKMITSCVITITLLPHGSVDLSMEHVKEPVVLGDQARSPLTDGRRLRWS